MNAIRRKRNRRAPLSNPPVRLLGAFKVTNSEARLVFERAVLYGDEITTQIAWLRGGVPQTISACIYQDFEITVSAGGDEFLAGDVIRIDAAPLAQFAGGGAINPGDEVTVSNF